MPMDVSEAKILKRFERSRKFQVLEAGWPQETREGLARFTREAHDLGLDFWIIGSGEIRLGIHNGKGPAQAVFAWLVPSRLGLRISFSRRVTGNGRDSNWESMGSASVTRLQTDSFTKMLPLEKRTGRWPDDYTSLPIMDDEMPAPDQPAPIFADVPLNQILFGPPGTGKTFHTVNAALQILAPECLNDDNNTRADLKHRFDEFVASGQISFVTFHQSFSYEDFVEGLRADVINGGLGYTIEAGVFKRLCEAAASQPELLDVDIASNARVWKVSIDGSGSNPLKTYCMDHGEVRIGWGKTGSLELPERNGYYQQLGRGDQGTLGYFHKGMKPGDVVICLNSSSTLSAVGVITGDYRYETEAPAGVTQDFRHVRPVRWLYRDLNLSILPVNGSRQLTQKTVYLLERITWSALLDYLNKEGAQPVPDSFVAEPAMPHVLIIDEINRGNVSRIFGELITLIEPSKRIGAEEALRVNLPYSKLPFGVPDNVYLIGTMNTTDRSLTGLDIALRRRFSFREMPPRPELLDGVNVGGINIGTLLRLMNERIEVLLDREHCLGHAYFMPLEDDRSLARLGAIFRNQVLPLLQEYFFEDWERIQWVLNDHNKAFADRFIQKKVRTVSELFGSNIDARIEGSSWSVNEQAFARAKAFEGIVAVKAESSPQPSEAAAGVDS
jgi:5-methylcytosine-specific restriction protein B